MSKDLNNTILFDIYSPLLTDKQRNTLDLYLNEDLSLSEISELSGITRQGVLGCIKTGISKLEELEKELCLAARFKDISEKMNELEELLRKEQLNEEKAVLEKLNGIKELL